MPLQSFQNGDRMNTNIKKPFNINRLLETTSLDETPLKTTHDAIGTGTRPFGAPGGDVDQQNRHSAGSLSEEYKQAGQEKVVYDAVQRPRHYNVHPSGVECIEVTRWMNFNLGNCFKYIWRADEKGATIEDLEKAQWYLADEIDRLKKLRGN